MWKYSAVLFALIVVAIGAVMLYLAFGGVLGQIATFTF